LIFHSEYRKSMNIIQHLVFGGDQNRKFWADYLPTDNILLILLLLGIITLLGYMYVSRSRKINAY